MSSKKSTAKKPQALTQPSEMDVKLQVTPKEAKDFYMGVFFKACEQLGYQIAYPTLKNENDKVDYLIVGTRKQVDRIVRLIESEDAKKKATPEKTAKKKSKKKTR